MTNHRFESNVATAASRQSAILPRVTYGPMTLRMAIMALIMGGTDVVAAGRRA